MNELFYLFKIGKEILNTYVGGLQKNYLAAHLKTVPFLLKVFLTIHSLSSKDE